MKSILGCCLLLLSHAATAMQVLDEQQLSNETGQSGITVKMDMQNSNANTSIGLVSFVYVDKDGFSNGINLIANDGTTSNISYNTGTKAIVNFGSEGIKMMNAAGAKTTNPITTTFDVDAQNNAAVALLQFGLPSDIASLKLGITDISMQAGTGLADTTRINPLLTFSNGVAFGFAQAPLVSVMLGSQLLNITNAAIMNFDSMNISYIDFGTINVQSVGGAVGEGALSMTPKITGLNLTGSQMSLDSTGAVISVPNLNGMGVTLDNVGTSSANIASFGADGIAATNLKIRISGM